MGLYDFYRNGELTDWTLSVNGHRHRCHRLVLAHRSQYLRAILGRADPPAEVQLTFPFEVDAVLPQLLFYCYEGHLPKEISVAESIPLLAMAAKLEMQPLRSRLEASLLRALTTARAALSFLALTNRLAGDCLAYFESIQSKSVQLIAQGLETVWDELHLLNPQQMSAILSTPSCARDGALVSHTITQFARRRVELAKELSASGQAALSQADFACLCDHVTDIHPHDIMVLLGLSIRLKDKRMRKKCLLAAAQYADDLDWDPEGLDGLAVLPCDALVEKHASQRVEFVSEPAGTPDALQHGMGHLAVRVNGRKRPYFKASQVTQDDVPGEDETALSGMDKEDTFDAADAAETIQGSVSQPSLTPRPRPPTSSNADSASVSLAAPAPSDQDAPLWHEESALQRGPPPPAPQSAEGLFPCGTSPGTPPRRPPGLGAAPHSVQSSQALFSQASAGLGDGGPGGAKRPRLGDRSAWTPGAVPTCLASTLEPDERLCSEKRPLMVAIEGPTPPATEMGPSPWAATTPVPPRSKEADFVGTEEPEEEEEEEEDGCSQGMAAMLRQINGAIDAHQRRRNSQVARLLQEEVARLEAKLRAAKGTAEGERMQFAKDMEAKVGSLEASLEDAQGRLATQSQAFQRHVDEAAARYAAAAQELQRLQGELHSGLDRLVEAEDKFFADLKETVESDLASIDTHAKQVSQQHTMQLLSKVLSTPLSQPTQPRPSPPGAVPDGGAGRQGSPTTG